MERVKIKFRVDDREYTGKISKESRSRLQNFTKAYKLETYLDGGKQILLGEKISKDKRICRFCNKGVPDVSFKKEAHVITQQWNRSKTVSHFECDNCNDRFSVFESDFGHFFLIERSLFGHNKKKGKPKFKTDKGTQIYSENPDVLREMTIRGQSIDKLLNEKNIKVIRVKQGIDDSEINISNRSTDFKLIRKPYRPLNVFRVFLKIGLSLIEKDELADFSSMMKVLNSPLQVDKKDEKKISVICLFQFKFRVLESFFEYPIAYLFNRINSSQNVVKKTLVIFFCNSIYQIPIPSDDDMRRIYGKGEDMKVIKASPYWNPFLSQSMFDDDKFHELVEDMEEIVRDLYQTSLVKDSFVSFTVSQDYDSTKLD